MFGSLGMPEILFILVLALLVFGPKRLPELGRTLGRGLREFRRATTDLKRTVETEMEAADAEPARTMTAVKPLATRQAEAAQGQSAPAEPTAAEPTAAEPAAETPGQAAGTVPRDAASAAAPEEPAAPSADAPEPAAEAPAETAHEAGVSRAAE